MHAGVTRSLFAAVLAGALFTAGCELLAPPPPTQPSENVGVDPSGENLDTSTVPPQDLSDEPLTAEAPPTTEVQPPPSTTTQAQPPPTPTPKPPAPDEDTSINSGSSGPPPATLPNTGGSPGVTHHRRAHRDRGSRQRDSGD